MSVEPPALPASDPVVVPAVPATADQIKDALASAFAQVTGASVTVTVSDTGFDIVATLNGRYLHVMGQIEQSETLESVTSRASALASQAKTVLLG